MSGILAFFALRWFLVVWRGFNNRYGGMNDFNPLS